MSTLILPTFITGNTITFTLPKEQGNYILSFPCSFKKLHVLQTTNLPMWRKKGDTEIINQHSFSIPALETYNFPVIDNKSPCTLQIARTTATASATLFSFCIDEIGGNNYEEYWNKSLDEMSGFPSYTTNKVIFVEQPQDVAITSGTNFSLSVNCIGTDLSYSWEYSDDNGKNWTQSRTGNPINFIASASFNNRLIRCKVTNIYGTIYYSNPAKITIIAPQSDLEDEEE